MENKGKTRLDLNTIIAITISVLTVSSALLGWQIGNVSGEASGEYSAAQRAELNAQKVISANTLIATENHRAFLEYKRYYDEYQLASAKLIQAESADQDKRDETAIAKLQDERMNLRALYISSLKLFPNDFITHEGTYNIEAQLGQMWAKAARDEDLYPTPHLEGARKLDMQVQKMQVSLLLLAISLFFFAVISTVETLQRKVLFAFVLLGYIFAISGMAMGLIYWKVGG